MATKKKQEEEEQGGIVLKIKFSDDRRKTYTIALADLTSQEQIDTEEFFDRPFMDCVASGWLLASHKGLIWLAYLARRRSDPDFTYEEAIEKYDTNVDDQSERPTEPSKDAGSHT